MAGLNSLVSDTGVQTTSMPSWYEDTQKKVASGATDVLNTGTIAPSETVTQKAVDELGGQGPNPYTKSTDALTSIAAGAANPWMTNFETGEVTPDTSTAMGGLFQAQRDYLNQILPEVGAGATSESVGSGGFGSLRGQTAAQKARGDAFAKLVQDQMSAALQNQQTGTTAAKGAADVESSYLKSLQDVGGWQQASPYTNISNYSKVVGGIQAPTTVSNTTQYSPLSLIGGLANTLGGTGGLMTQLFGTGGKGGLLNAVRGMFSGPNAQGVTEITNTSGEGEPGYGWKYYSDGTAISPSGTYYFGGNEVWNPSDTYSTDETYQGPPDGYTEFDQ